MNIKNLWDDFEKTYLYTSDRVKYCYEDKKLNKIDVMNAFSVLVNYHSDTCIHILKDTQLCSYFWRDLKKRYDLTKLYLRYDKLHNLI
jgi:hypothetical protein